MTGFVVHSQKCIFLIYNVIVFNVFLIKLVKLVKNDHRSQTFEK